MKTQRLFHSCFFALVLFMFMPTQGQAQPQAFKYQGIARNAANQPLINQNITLRLSIVSDPDGDGDGPLLYRERHDATTSDLGIFALNVGQGTVLNGNFAGISWGSSLLALRTELDPAGGNNFTFMGSSPLLAVPFALYAQSAGSAPQADPSPVNELQNLTLDGTQLGISQGNTVDLSGLGGGGSGPWQLNGANVFYNAGNVGLGTNAPMRRLEIRDNTTPMLRLHAFTTAGTTEAGIELLRGNTSGTDWKIANDGGTLRLTTANDNFTTAGTPVAEFTATGSLHLFDGNFGVGTDAPARKAEIRDDASALLRLHAFTTAGTTESGIELVRGNTSGTDWKIANDGGTLRITTTGDNFATAGETVAAFSSNGNLDLFDNRVLNLAAPQAGTDAVNRDWVTAQINTAAGDAVTDANTYTQTYVAQYFADNFTTSAQMISPLSAEALTLPQAATHCRNLVYNGYTDWHLPTAEEMVYFWEYPGTANIALWTSTPFSYVDVDDGNSSNFVYFVTINPNATNGSANKDHFTAEHYCRCVR